LVFVHESNLGTVFDSLMVEAQNDRIDADETDKKGKYGQKCEISERLHEVDAEEAGCEGN
jgi:hypothetical protein